jgi:protein SCO1/2
MALQKYAQRFSINTRQWQLLTGSKQAIYKLARNSFEIVATDGDGGPDDFIHSEKLVLVDRQRRIRGYYDGTDDTAIKNLIRDIKKLQHEE